MKTKYIKVNIAETLPEKNGVYFSWINNPNAELHEDPDDYNKICRTFKDGQFNSFYDVTHCLIEVTDKEQEMRKFIEKVQFDIQSGLYPQGEMYDYEINDLLRNH